MVKLSQYWILIWARMRRYCSAITLKTKYPLQLLSGYSGYRRRLLCHLAGYQPHSYLTNKIVSGIKGLKDVWNMIYDHYGLQVSSESLLDFERTEDFQVRIILFFLPFLTSLFVRVVLTK